MSDFFLSPIIICYQMITKIIRKGLLSAPTFSQAAKESLKVSQSNDSSNAFKSIPTKFTSGESFTSQDEMRAKELTLSAFFLIRYYRMRGHESAQLDPLSKYSLYLDLKNFEQFGKIYAKKPLELDLKKNNILNDSDLDVPFKIPHHSIFSREISVLTFNSLELY